MSADRDLAGLVRSWLRQDDHEDADRVLNEVLAQLDVTPQRRAGWLARRFPIMNSNTLRFGIAGVAVVVLVLLGVRFLPGSNFGGAPRATPSPTASATPPATSQASPSATLRPGEPPFGQLDAGTYTYYDIDGTGVNATFTVPSGWAWNGWLVNTGAGSPPSGASIQFWSGDLQVYTDPCRWGGAEPDPPTGASVDDLVQALSEQPTRDATTPVDIAVGSYSGSSVTLIVPEGTGLASCDGGQFRSWLSAVGERYHQANGQRDTVWAIDVDGTRMVIDSFIYSETSIATAAQLQAVLDSLRFSR